MTTAFDQQRLNRKLRHDLPGRVFQDIPGSRWGELILPAAAEARARDEARLSVLAVAAYQFGARMLESLIAFERARPKDLRLVAVCTDDAVEESAKLSMHKRLWRFFDAHERFEMTAEVIETGLQAGLSVYTGELKIDWFRQQLKSWAPDLILVCGCGQLFDDGLLSVPKYGVINFHPADLPGGHGAGAQPFRDLQDRDDPWTRMTIHKMTTELDAGPAIGVSCPVNIGNAQGHVTATGKQFVDRMSACVPELTSVLVDTVLRKNGPVDAVDFEARLSDDLIRQMAEPTT